MKMTFQEIRIIATGPCIANQLRDVNTICRRSWYIATHIWKFYDFKIEVVPFIINISTELITSVFNKRRKPANFAVYCVIFFGYFISDKNRSVLFRDQLYVFLDCLYSGSVFDSVCFSPFFRFETGNQSLLDLNNFLDLTLASFLC